MNKSPGPLWWNHDPQTWVWPETINHVTATRSKSTAKNVVFAIIVHGVVMSIGESDNNVSLRNSMTGECSIIGVVQSIHCRRDRRRRCRRRPTGAAEGRRP